ncbi:MAG: gliding motility-associated C-terminal domain-containing protein, partial [Muribaculaceae bacterium]|nr:gliding motility-associated C-terminal domain-containing protein [Muribaculaceae bacterium]
FEVNIGASKLLCPNAFSPGDQNGVNDIWKVSYSSLTSFECDIFNRWGVHIIKLTDPSQGWDGRYRGKLVESGVYYYVIRARGTDGVDYKLSGDINVINYSIRSKNSTTE